MTHTPISSQSASWGIQDQQQKEKFYTCQPLKHHSEIMLHKELLRSPVISGLIQAMKVYNHFGMSIRRSSRSAFGRSTGNDVSGHYKQRYSLVVVFSPFPPSSTFPTPSAILDFFGVAGGE